jgi:site-specific recombinase XerC
VEWSPKVTIVARGKCGIWTAEFWQGGQHRHRSLKTANFKARSRAHILEGELATGDYATPPKSVSIARAVEEFMAGKKAEGKAHKTLVKYQGELDCFRDALAGSGTLTLRQVTPSSFEEYRATRMKDHKPKTVYTAAIIIKGFFRWVFQRRMLATNPLLSCNVSKPYVAPKAVPKSEEVEKLVSAAQGNRQIQYALLAFSGIRAGELQMLSCPAGLG